MFFWGCGKPSGLAECPIKEQQMELGGYPEHKTQDTNRDPARKLAKLRKGHRDSHK
jgi:hypothetical protein